MKKINFLSILACIVFGALLTNCESDDKNGQITAITIKEAVYVSSINWMQLSLKDNATLQMTPFIMPRNAANQTVSYANKHPELMEVSPSGLITGKAPGIDTLTVSATDGSDVTVSYQVVIIDHIVKATGINVTAEGSNITLKTNGASFDLAAHVTLTPEDTWDKTVTYTSNDVEVVTVSSAGILAPVNVGSTTVTIQTADGSNISRNVNVYVQDVVQRWDDFDREAWTIDVTTATGYRFAADAISGSAAAGWSYTQGMPELLLDGNISTYFMIAKPGQAYPYNREGFPLENIPTQDADFMPSFTVDMKEAQTFNYILWVHRQFNNRSQWYGCRVYGSNDKTAWTQIRSEEHEVAGSDILWIPQARGYVGDMGSPFDNATHRLLVDESTFRYVKIELAMWSNIYNSQHPDWTGAGSASGMTVNIGEFGLGLSYWE